MAATLIANEADFISCVIRDYCSGGLFIELNEHDNLATLSTQQVIQVHFSIENEQGIEDFSEQVKIVHINSIGVGVAFEEGAEDFYNALAKESQANTATLTSQNSSVDNEVLENLETDLTSLLEKELHTLICDFYSYCNKKIKETIAQSADYQEQVTLQDASTNLKINKEALFKSFCSGSNQKVSLFSTPSSLEQTDEDETEEDSSLSLVAKDDFEDWLNLAEIIKNLETLFEADLTTLKTKLAFILKVDKELIVNPINPAFICGLFRDSISKIEEDEKTKNWLYEVFGELLVDLLPDLHGEIDAILVAHGAPDKLTAIKKEKRKSSYRAPPITNNSDQSEENVESVIDESNHAPVNTPTSNTTAVPTVEVSPTAPTTQPIVEANQKPLVQSTPIPATASPNPTLIPTREANQVLNIASSLLGLLQNPNTQQKNNIEKKVTDESFSTTDISKALANIQQQTINQSEEQNPVALKQELQQALAKFSADHKNISTADKNNIEVQSSLFNVLFDDTLLAQDSQSYLQQIQLPIMAQAMHDPGFLESNNNSARNIINHLYWLETAIKDNKLIKNSQIKAIVDPLIEKISNESLDDPAVFNQVEKKLNDITQSINKSVAHNIKRVHETYEGKQKLEEARHFVQREMNRHFAEKELPKIIITLLESGWQHLLVIAKLNNDRKEYQRHLLTIFNLITWLTGEKKFSKNLAKMTLEIIDTHLQPISANAFTHNNILSELKKLLLESDLQPESDAVEMAVFKPIKNTKPLSKVSHTKDEASQLQIGEWLTFLLDKEVESLKLAWINKSENIFVFVDKNGLKKLELERVELVELIKTGAANRIESLDLPVMDRATNKMVQNLHEKLIFNATRDPITGLLNRKEFVKQLKIELAGIDNAKYLLCNIEVQDFRIITNTCGLSAGDALLNQLANILKEQQKKGDIYSRLDDKTFSILFINRKAEVAKQLQAKLIDTEFKWEDKSYAVAVSMGIVPLFSGNNYEITNLFRRADSATLSASNAGRNRIRVYKENDESLKSQYNAHEWVGRINQIFAENRLFLRCQQIAAIDPEKDSHMHYEILLGIKDEKGNTIPPDNFIPAVERCQRMSEVDKWVVLAVFEWIDKHPDIFATLDGFSINLSGESMNSEEFLDFLRKTLAVTKIPLEKITFEITETVAAGSFKFVQSFIKKIKRFKCKFSLDDFGSGYSSYSYLKSLDVDYLKIDGIFVKDLPNNATDIAIVKSMNEIAHSLNLKTIAEYVENDAILAILKEMGVDYAQGWGIQKPILLNDLKLEEPEALLQEEV